jgi:hypothetical protein
MSCRVSSLQVTVDLELLDMKNSSVPLEYFETWLAINGFVITSSSQRRVCERIDDFIKKRPTLKSTAIPADSNNFFSKPLDEILTRHTPKNLRHAMLILCRLSRELHEINDNHRPRSRQNVYRESASLADHSDDRHVSKLKLMNALLETVYLAADAHEVRSQRKAVIQRAEALSKAIAARR